MTTEEVLEGIAKKLWWGWNPQVSGKGRWSIPFEQRTEPMTQEELQWFKSH